MNSGYISLTILPVQTTEDKGARQDCHHHPERAHGQAKKGRQRGKLFSHQTKNVVQLWTPCGKHNSGIHKEQDGGFRRGLGKGGTSTRIALHTHTSDLTPRWTSRINSDGESRRTARERGIACARDDWGEIAMLIFLFPVYMLVAFCFFPDVRGGFVTGECKNCAQGCQARSWRQSRPLDIHSRVPLEGRVFVSSEVGQC